MIPTTTVYVEVKCSERLPDKPGYYLVTLRNGENLRVYYNKDAPQVFWKLEAVHWLEKREDKYLLTKSQLEEALIEFGKILLEEFYPKTIDKDKVLEPFIANHLNQK